ncbi:hypothetical protein ABFS82_07G068000 [Erythranthe guttata]|uniref:Uncharacterized protein n=1 Tax=Erythranthe guttata TaxID=4155 RepID=A0A022QV90_ERYGU|nr:PREDICTED: cis-muuroladiene synthase-like [Erythranthe guttata]EYU31464.1 hypothetical protein MIMGU_mgv1a003909mg [Erythranthe guttata]|eukprot:XP_012844573.1 PREDICTED: cis-muuroladiene synthase-like [Erythranthe guttata]
MFNNANNTVDVPPSTCLRDLRPPVTIFKPSMWGHTFASFSLDHQVQETYEKTIEAIKKKVRSILMAKTSGKPILILVDTLVRLGLAYHFETEIEEKLEQIYKEDEEFDLFTTALRFRLLRQHRHQVSCSVFDKFTNKDNKLEESLIGNDVEGLLSLYEAAHVRIRGEDILEEAVPFTKHHLTRHMLSLESPLKDKVKRALVHSLHRGVPIIEARVYISIYEKDDSRDEIILKLAKLNFNYLQNMYKEELSELYRWWNNFDLKSKLPYARDRWIECYMWGVAFHFEPQYSYVRNAVAKAMQMVSILDDTYDNYATLNEAQLFTDVLERWDMNEIGQLPDYMKVVYQFIMSVSEVYEREATQQGKSFAIPSYKEAVKQLARAYNIEQSWIMERKMPPLEEYLKNSVITSCVFVMFTAHFPGMKSVTQETIDWLLSNPKIVVSTAMIGRHIEDLGSHERENREGKYLTVVDCYIKHYGISKEEVLSMFEVLVEDAWKDISKEWANKTEGSIPKEIVEQLVNYARVAEVTYRNSDDGYTDPEKNLGPHIVALFVDPIVI